MVREGDSLGLQGEGCDAGSQRGGGRRPGEVNRARVVEIYGGLRREEEMHETLISFNREKVAIIISSTTYILGPTLGQRTAKPSNCEDSEDFERKLGTIGYTQFKNNSTTNTSLYQLTIFWSVYAPEE